MSTLGMTEPSDQAAAACEQVLGPMGAPRIGAATVRIGGEEEDVRLATTRLVRAINLLGLPALLVWSAVGALWQQHMPERTGTGPSRHLFTAAAAAVLFLALLGTVRSAAQLASMGIHANASGAEWLRRGSRIDPGNYRLHVRLARAGSGLRRAERCEHAIAARDLYPEAREARNLARGCE